METLLKELETQLGRMTAAQREATARALRDIVQATRGLSDLHLSRATVTRGLQVILVGLAQRRTMADHLVEARKLAPKVGPYADALIQALS